VLWEDAKNITGHPKTKGDVLIGNDVWIATESIIMSGVNIGDGAVIGARAVVTKNVPPYTIVAGNPAVVVKQRFDDNTINQLLEIKWWNWDESRIKKALPLLLNNDIEKFLRFVESKALTS
jgi:serine acetyltransferase